MSVKAQSIVWEHSRQSGGHLLILLALAEFADNEMMAYPSVATLAERARLSLRQARRILRDLEASGEVKCLGEIGDLGIKSRYHKNVCAYRILLKAPDAHDRGQLETPDADDRGYSATPVTHVRPDTGDRPDTHDRGLSPTPDTGDRKPRTPMSAKPSVKPNKQQLPNQPQPTTTDAALDPPAEPPKADAAEWTKLIEAFDRAIVTAFGEAMARPWPAQADAPTARGLHDAGYTPQDVEAVTLGICQRKARGGGEPPKSIAYIVEALHEARQATSKARSSAPPPPAERTTADLALSWIMGEAWPEDAGPSPDKPDCEVDVGLLLGWIERPSTLMSEVRLERLKGRFRNPAPRPETEMRLH